MWLQYIYLLTACINSRSKEMYEVKRRPKGLGGGGGRVLPYSLGGGGCRWVCKSPTPY